MKRLYVVFAIFIFFLLIFVKDVFAKGFEIIETWQGYKIMWDAPEGAKVKIEIPAFCLEFDKQPPKKGTVYKLEEQINSSHLPDIFKMFRILKENYSLRREFILQDDFYTYLIKKALFISLLMESEKVRHEINKKPELRKDYELFIKSVEELLSSKVLRVAIQQAIWAEFQGITIYDLQRKISAEGIDFNPDLQAVIYLSLFTIAPYTQLILEASGSKSIWIKPEDKLRLKENADFLADKLILYNELERIIETSEKRLTVEERFKKAYAWFEMGDSERAWQYLKDVTLKGEEQKTIEVWYFRIYLEQRKRFDKFYQLALAKIKTNNLEKAEEYLKVALEILPYNPQAKYLLGLIKYTLGDKEEALKLWKEVVQETPLFIKQNFEARFARIACLRELGRYKEMWKEYENLKENL